MLLSPCRAITITHILLHIYNTYRYLGPSPASLQTSNYVQKYRFFFKNGFFLPLIPP